MTTNPLMALDAAAIDVLDDMLDEWNDRDRHGQLNGGFGYGTKKTAALSLLDSLIREAWLAKVRYTDVEGDEA